MKQIKKFSIVFLVVILLVGSFSVTVTAHEYSPSRYPRIVYRYTPMDIGVVNLTYYISSFSTSNYRTQLDNSIHDWIWEDDGHVQMTLTSESAAQVRFYDSWDNSQFGSTAFAITCSWITNGYASLYGNGWMGPPYQKSCHIYTKNEVYVNKVAQSNAGYNNYDIRKTWAHEIGHCLGFAETNDGTRSVMKQGKGSDFGWSNYWLPQDHERSDLSSKFKWTIVDY